MNAWKYKRLADETALYCFARCEQFCRDFAESSQISARELIDRVADLFFRQASGAQLGAEDHLPPLRGKATRNGDALAEVAVARGSRGGGAQVKPHWTQKPENRKKMLRNIQAMNGKTVVTYERGPTRPYKRTAKQMAAARANAVKARAGYMAKLRKERLAKLRKRQERQA